MKSLIRWSATLLLIGGTLFGGLSGSVDKALALPEEQIIKTLETVPVFAIADEQGVPLVAVDQQQKAVTGIFISRQDAEKFHQQLAQKNPEIASKYKVQIVSLGDVYKIQAANQEKPDGLIIDYVPSDAEVESAKKLLSEQGQQYQGGVPLYVAKAGNDGGYLTITQNNQQYVPFFFEKAAITGIVERLKKEQPELANSIRIEVIPLEGFIATLQESNDENLTKIVLVPSQDTISYIRSQTQPNPNNSTNPTPQR